MKEMTSVASTMMTEEEKAELEKQMNPPTAQSVAATAHVDPTPTTNGENKSPSSTSPLPGASDSTTNLTKQERDHKKRSKLTPEQRKKLDEIEVERKQAMEERISTLTAQLTERLRPFVDAKHPGDKDDPETITFEAKMRREADDMKLESFGVEVS
jgi:hypothetical protein